MKQCFFAFAGTLAACLSASCIFAAEFIYDEEKVPPYSIPDALLAADGSKVSDVQTWRSKRRPELMNLFETEVYGKMRGKPEKMTFDVLSADKTSLGGRATRKEIMVNFAGIKDGSKMLILLYIPNGLKKPVPAFVGLNFKGNHTVANDPGITLADQWIKNNRDGLMQRQRAGSEARGTKAS